MSLEAASPTDIKLQYNFVHFSIMHDQVILFEVEVNLLSDRVLDAKGQGESSLKEAGLYFKTFNH